MRETEQAKRETRREKIATMAATRKVVMPVMIVLIMVLSVAAVGAARPLAGEEWAGDASAAGGESVNRLLGQRLNGPGHSCSTWNPNGGCR